MSKAHRLAHRKKLPEVAGVDVAGVPLNFLLGASDQTLDDYELARLAAVADLLTQKRELDEKLIEQQALAGLVRWFRGQDRDALKHAIENEESPEEWAHRMMRDRQRSPEELLPRSSLPPGAAHLAAAKRYASRNLAEGKCSVCPEPLDRNSVCFCTKHLGMKRDRERQKKALSDPGSREFLYSGEITESQHGRTPGTLRSLEMNREKKTRAVLAELGIPPESAAVSLKAAKEALLRVMRDSRAKALSPADLFQAAVVPSRNTGNRALRELLSAGQIQRIGQPKPGHPCRYWLTAKPKPAISGKLKNQVLLQTLRGEEPGQ